MRYYSPHGEQTSNIGTSCRYVWVVYQIADAWAADLTVIYMEGKWTDKADEKYRHSGLFESTTFHYDQINSKNKERGVTSQRR